MREQSDQSHRGPVTLVVARQQGGGGTLSWTFANEATALSVTQAFLQSERWTLVRGTYASAAHALDAASRCALILDDRGSGMMRKCEPLEEGKQRSSA